MVVVTRRHLHEAMWQYPDAAKDLSAWMEIAQLARWKNMAEVNATFKSADEVDGYTIFNIRHNRYRLVTVIHYAKQRAGIETQGSSVYPLAADAYGVRQPQELGQEVPTMKKKFADPVKMMELGAPRLIGSEAELERYTDALFALTSLPRPTEAELDAINLLGLLVERYESERCEVPKSSPAEMLRFLMEQNGLQQKDLMRELGSASNVSLILSGRRSLTVPHMQRLGRRFGVPAAVFLETRAVAA